MPWETKINLHPYFFRETEKKLAEFAGLTASVFLYDSGVCGLRLVNQVGQITMLPFQGQQIWRAVMHGRDLTMRSMFAQPARTQVYLQTYGAFFIHCGFTAIGPAVAPTDNYPLHGELPNAPYTEAHLELGSDERGDYIALGGAYQHTVAFSCNYVARPRVKLYAGSSLFAIELAVENLKKTPMEYMYLGHINFRPVDGSRLAYSACVSNKTVRVRTSIPPHIPAGLDYRALLDQLASHPELHHEVRADLRYDPEVVFNIDYLPDNEGFGHTLQLLPGGGADYVRHRVDQLPNVLRWLCRTPEQDALGMAEVATAGVEGFAAEKALGHVRQLAGGAVWRTAFDVGVLDRAETERVLATIAQVVG